MHFVEHPVVCTFGVDVFVLQPPVSLSELEIGINQWAAPPEEAGIYKRMKKKGERGNESTLETTQRIEKKKERERRNMTCG